MVREILKNVSEKDEGACHPERGGGVITQVPL